MTPPSLLDLCVRQLPSWLRRITWVVLYDALGHVGVACICLTSLRLNPGRPGNRR